MTSTKAFDGPPARTPGYDALVSGAAVWVGADRALLRVAGSRADAALNGLLSTDVAAVPIGGAAISFVLTSKGRPVAVPTVVRLEDAILLDVSRSAVSDLLDHFGTYLPPRLASVTVLEEARRISLLGPEASGVAARLDVSGCLARVERHPEDGRGVDLYFARGGPDPEAIVAAATAAGCVMARPTDHETWRIELGIPRFGCDITPDNLPQETGLVARAVSFDKGCYTGQEVVARIHYRGKVNRHLRGIRCVEPLPAGRPAPGTELRRDGRIVGTVTSSCASPRLGSIGLGYVRHEVEVGGAVEAACEVPVAALVVDIPFTLP